MRRIFTILACSAAISLSSASAQNGTSPTFPRDQAGASQQAGAEREHDEITAEDFVYLATLALLFEIEVAELGAANAQDEAMRAFAIRFRADREAALEDLRRAAPAIDAPDALEADDRTQLEALAREQGANFDAQFIGMVIDAQEHALGLYEDFVETAKDDDLEDFASAQKDRMSALLEEAVKLEETLESADEPTR
jgi:putative membrane protein